MYEAIASCALPDFPSSQIFDYITNACCAHFRRLELRRSVRLLRRLRSECRRRRQAPRGVFAGLAESFLHAAAGLLIVPRTSGHDAAGELQTRHGLRVLRRGPSRERGP